MKKQRGTGMEICPNVSTITKSSYSGYTLCGTRNDIFIYIFKMFLVQLSPFIFHIIQ